MIKPCKQFWNFPGLSAVTAAVFSLASALTVQAQDPHQDSNTLTRQGIMSIRAGKYDEGIKSLDEAIQKNPKNSLAFFWRGQAKADQGNYKNAIADFDKVIELAPDEPTAYVARADVRRKVEDESGMKKDMDLATKLDPTYTQPPEEIMIANPPGKPDEKGKKLPLADMMGKLVDLSEKELIVEQNIHRGMAKLNLNDYKAALDYINKALGLDSKNIRAYLLRGLAKYYQSDYKGALLDYDAAITLDPKNALAYSYRATLWFHLRELKKALTDADKAITLNPKLAEPYLIRANVKIDMNYDISPETPVIRTDAEMALKLNQAPGTARDYRNLGWARVLRVDFQGALEAFNKAIELNPHYADAYSHRGRIRQHLGDLQGAMQDCNEAIRLNPDLPMTYVTRSILRLRAGDLQEGESDCGRAIQLNPDIPEAYWFRGMIRTKSGDYKNALADLEQAVKLNPSMRKEVQADIDEARKKLRK